MLNILIVEDEPLFAETLKYLIELNPRYLVTDVVEDCAGAMAAVQRRRPDLARTADRCRRRRHKTRRFPVGR